MVRVWLGCKGRVKDAEGVKTQGEHEMWMLVKAAASQKGGGCVVDM